MRKSLAVGIIVLFIGVSIQPSMGAEIPDKIEVEPKDYLFQTIIDIANNPEVKSLLEQYDYDLLKVDIDRSVYRKIFFRNLRLFFDILFTKPSMSVEYLNFVYNQGIKIANIIGKDKVLGVMESIEVTNLEFFDELNQTIINDEELSHRISILKEMNKELNPDSSWEDYPIICSLLVILFFPIFLIGAINGTLGDIFNENGNIILFFITFLISIPITLILIPPLLLFFFVFDCLGLNPYEPFQLDYSLT